MNFADAILWGLLATVVQTTIEAAGRGLGVTRMSLPFMLGTMLTPDRSRAPLVGLGVHLLNGWILALLYALFFERSRAGWWVGAAIGCVHGLFVLTVVMVIMPTFHPRMASESQGPDPTPLLQPPGFMAMNYGRMSTLVTLAAHVAYGLILGALYEPAS